MAWMVEGVLLLLVVVYELDDNFLHVDKHKLGSFTLIRLSQCNQCSLETTGQHYNDLLKIS